MGVPQEKTQGSEAAAREHCSGGGTRSRQRREHFVQSGARGVVNQNYVLLDNQSTINQIANPSLLANIRKAKSQITVHCNNGLSYTNLEGDLDGITMYHNPYGIANVLSLESTKAKHRVIYDSWDCDGVFKVHTKEGIVEF